MKKYGFNLLCLLFLFTIGINAQEKQAFKFIEINKKQAWDGGYVQRDFEYTRVYHENNIIEEIGILPGSHSFFFKIKKGNWYIKNLKQWEIFYSPEKNVSPKIFSFDRWFSLKFEKKDFVNTSECSVYTFQNEEYSTKQGDKTIIHSEVNDFPFTQYWFNKELGIIKIRSGDFEFVREDILKK